MANTFIQKAESAPAGHLRIVFRDQTGCPVQMEIHYADQPPRIFPAKNISLGDFHQQKARLAHQHPDWQVE